jgi:uroporphyrinogen decarboxylase
MKMTSRERFLAFARFEPVDRVPRYASFVESLEQKLTGILGRSPNDFYPMDRVWCDSALTPPSSYTRPDFSGYYPDHRVGEKEFSIDSNGVGHLGHGFYHFTEYISPLRNAESFSELERYPIPVMSDWSDTAMRKEIAERHAAGRPAGCFLGHMYEDAWQIRGYEPFLIDLLTQRDWAEHLLDRIAVNNRASAIAAARAGADLILSGDDVANQNAMMFTPDLWREVFKPRWAATYAAARAIKPDIQIWYHSDGNITDILDDLVEIGITILNPVQPECVDPRAIRKRFGKRLAFDGCVGTQTTFPFGTPDDMRNVVRGLKKDLDAMNGGLMLSPTHVLEPEVTPENIRAFFEACDEEPADSGRRENLTPPPPTRHPFL